jgi:hypothetical protein
MMKKSKIQSFLEKLKENFKKTWETFQKVWKRINETLAIIKRFTDKHAYWVQNFQLTLLYFIGISMLLIGSKRYLIPVPDSIRFLVPFCDFILNSRIMKTYMRPDLIFLVYYIVVELSVRRPILKISLLLKFNILLVYMLEMLSTVAVTWWDAIYMREIPGKIIYMNEPEIYKFLSTEVFFFLCLYIYSYGIALLNRYPRYPGILQAIPNSMAAWLKMKPVGFNIAEQKYEIQYKKPAYYEEKFPKKKQEYVNEEKYQYEKDQNEYEEEDQAEEEDKYGYKNKDKKNLDKSARDFYENDDNIYEEEDEENEEEYEEEHVD